MHFLSLSDFKKEELEEILLIAANIKDKMYLKGKTVILFFPESSIRTRVTFEKAVRDMGGEVILFPPESLDKKENITDVIGYLNNWADCIVIRHPDYKKLKRISECSKVPVINAMTDVNHPCEILSDIFSLRKINKNIFKTSAIFLGPETNILNSWINASAIFSFELIQVCPEQYKSQLKSDYFSFSDTTKVINKNTGFILTDSLPIELINSEYINRYQLTTKLLHQASGDVLFNPCPPFHRGEEVSEEAIKSKHFVGYDFKKSLLTVQKAIVIYTLGLNP